MAQFNQKTRRGIRHLLGVLKDLDAGEKLSNTGDRKTAGHPVYAGLSMPERKELYSLLHWLATKMPKALSVEEVDAGLKAATSTSEPMPVAKQADAAAVHLKRSPAEPGTRRLATALTPTGVETRPGN